MALDPIQLMDRCQQHNKSLTPQRMAVLEALDRETQAVSAYALKDALVSSGYRFNISTIYRVLDFWTNLSIVHKLESNSTYVLCQDDHRGHLHIVLHCVKCNESEESSELSQRIALPVSNGFRPVQDQVVEFKGVCRHCAR